MPFYKVCQGSRGTHFDDIVDTIPTLPLPSMISPAVQIFLWTPSPSRPLPGTEQANSIFSFGTIHKEKAFLPWYPPASIVLLCTPQNVRFPDSHTEPEETTQMLPYGVSPCLSFARPSEPVSEKMVSSQKLRRTMTTQYIYRREL